MVHFLLLITSYSFCGLTRHRPASAQTVLESESPYWIYRYDRPELPGKWTQILPEKDAVEDDLPLPRFAHQVVYHSKSGVLYMHGGNGGISDDDEEEEPELERRPASSGTGVEAGVVITMPGIPKDGDEERRLDDFWRMEILR